MSAHDPLYPSPSAVRTMVTFCSLCGTVATCFTLLRLYAKWRYLKLLLDDLFMSGAAAFFLVYCVAVSCATRSVENNKVVDLAHIKVAVKLLNIAEFFYILCLMLLKISLGIFFLKLTFSRVQHIIIYVAVTLSLIFSVIMFLFAVFQCGYYRSVGEFLLRRLTNKCASNATALGLGYTHATMAAVTDWVFILLPVFIFWPTLKSLDQKVRFGLFMTFVSIAGVASVARMPYVSTLAIPKRGFLAHVTGIAVWSALEPGIGIIAACIITLKPLCSIASSTKDLGYLDLEMAPSAPPAEKKEMIRVSDEIVEEFIEATIEVTEPRSIYLEPQPVFKAPKQTRRGNVFMLTRPGARDPGLPLMVYDSGSDRENDARETQSRTPSTSSR